MIKNHGLTFLPETHEYYHNGILQKSATQILKEIGFAGDYASVPKKKLQEASEKGTLIHTYLQAVYNKSVILEDVPEHIRPYIEAMLESRFWDIYDHSGDAMFELPLCLPELKVAGTADMVVRVCGDDNNREIWDLKTGNADYLDMWTTAWQVGIYKYLYNNSVSDEPLVDIVGVIYFEMGHNGRLIMRTKELPNFVSQDKIAEMLEHFLITGMYAGLKVILRRGDEEQAIRDCEVKEMAARNLESAAKQAREEADEAKFKVLKVFENNSVKEYESDLYKFRYNAGYPVKRFDSVRFKAESPKLYENYVKTVLVEPKITIKED
ncbi:hypothetical protein AGMMS49573_07880 [Endomicrobiia bacterium]|nr:hypothetical protein AGMMS49573_07880 [Endomicrobiia bacterium]